MTKMPTDEEIIQLCYKAGFSDTQLKTLIREVGAYSIDTPTYTLKEFVKLVLEYTGTLKPYCPKCGYVLFQTRPSLWSCRNISTCGWEQHDQDQRPNMPDKIEGGYHYEWKASGPWNKYGWIAVKDDAKPDLDREIESEDYLNDSGKDEPAPVKWCGNCHSKTQICQLPFSQKSPTSCCDNWTHVASKPSESLSTTFRCPRCEHEMVQDFDTCGDPWVCCYCDFPWGEKSSTKSPSVGKIDHIRYSGPQDFMDKLNEVIDYINRKG